VKLDLKLDILGNLKFGEKRCRIKGFFTRVDFDFWVIFCWNLMNFGVIKDFLEMR